jgi:hypothetical protein
MNIWKSIPSLRPAFIIGFIVTWNLIMGFGIHLNGGFGPFSNLSSLLVAAFGTTALAIISIGAIHWPAVRAVVLRPTARLSDAKPGLMFLGLLGGLLTVLTLLSAMRSITWL